MTKNKATITNVGDTVVIELDNLTATLRIGYDVQLRKVNVMYQVEGHPTEFKKGASARDIWTYLNDMGV